jgi:hypothetical protein
LRVNQSQKNNKVVVDLLEFNVQVMEVEVKEVVKAELSSQWRILEWQSENTVSM